MLASNPGDPPWAMITFDGDVAGTFEVSSAEATLDYQGSGPLIYRVPAGATGIVTVDTYGAVGGLIEGTFDAIAYVWDSMGPTGATADVSGSFSMARAPDGFKF
jgi:hypothetical protein